MRMRAVIPATLGVVLGLGCGGSSQRADVTPGPMPTGGAFTGVWFSPQYGEMHMVETGASVVGEYHKDERRGRIQGTVQGDLMRFEWEEQREMLAGRSVTTHGRGYFRLQFDSNGDQVIVGEWGHDLNEVGGGPWRAVKSRTRRPRLTTDSTASETSGSDESGQDEYESSGSDGSEPEEDTSGEGDLPL